MYNSLCQVYCIKPEERIHLYTKGSRSVHIHAVSLFPGADTAI